MRILIITPLYPPDIAPLAVYVKECAKRLQPEDDVTILAYAHIPENIPGVRIIAIPKDTPLLFRLFHFTWALIRELRRTEMLYVQNGASVELPFALVSFFTRIPSIMYVADSVPLHTAQKHLIPRLILRLALMRATQVIHTEKNPLPYQHTPKATLVELPLPRPEILPLTPTPIDVYTDYETSWEKHIALIRYIFDYAK